MKILIVSATYSEIKQVFEKTEFVSNHDDFLSSHLSNGNEIDFLITGIGIASTAYRLGKLSESNKYDLALNLGIAGSFNKELKIGEVVNVESDLISELGAENADIFMKFDELNIEQKSAEKTIWQVKNKNIISNNVIQNLPEVKGITVNTVHGNDRSVEKIIQMFHPDIETMEGATFLYYCNEEKIKCAQIRSVSNYVEARNNAKWNINLAIENLNDTVLKILKTL